MEKPKQKKTDSNIAVRLTLLHLLVLTPPPTLPVLLPALLLRPSLRPLAGEGTGRVSNATARPAEAVEILRFEETVFVGGLGREEEREEERERDGKEERKWREKGRNGRRWWSGVDRKKRRV